MDHVRAVTGFVGGDSLQMPFCFSQHIFLMFILTVKGTWHDVDVTDTVLLHFPLVSSKTIKLLKKVRAVYSCK